MDKIDDRLAEIEKRLEAATKGPWEAQMPREPYPNWYLVYAKNSDPPLLVQVLRGTAFANLMSESEARDGKSSRSIMARSNADFIAHAPEDIRYLLDKLNAARDDLEDHEAWLAWVGHGTTFRKYQGERRALKSTQEAG